MKSTYVGTWSANMSDIRCLFALASDSTSNNTLSVSSSHFLSRQYLKNGMMD